MILELFQALVDAQSFYGCKVQGAYCPGSAYNAITAAYNTQGYWVHGDFLFWIFESEMQLWAALLYILAALGGLIGVALGSPPRNYLWFFFGPCLFHFLLGTTVDVHGVQWNVGTYPQDQSVVWKLAEPGLRNTNAVIRQGTIISSFLPPKGGKDHFGRSMHGAIEVSQIFAWFDELISAQVQWWISWTGVHSVIPGVGGPGTNLAPLAGGTDYQLSGGVSHILTNLKWDILDDITSAHVNSVPIRDSFVQFMASECGDIIREEINQESYIAAANSNGDSLRNIRSVFRDYRRLTARLTHQTIPTPLPLKELMSSGPAGPPGPGSFQKFSGSNGFLNSAPMKNMFSFQEINCDEYLWILMHAFRWEAGHIYWQTIRRSTTQGGVYATLRPTDIVYNFFYGWELRWNSGAGALLNSKEQHDYMRDLVFVHLVRNELLFAPQVASVRVNSSEELRNSADTALSTTGSKSKFAEIYTWTKLLPHLQGVLLYYLAMAYPLACVLVVVPGWHKQLFTWASFYAWAKLWDLGFAVVSMVERSVWAMMGNTADASGISAKVIELQDYGRTLVGCSQGGGFGASPLCPVPFVENLQGKAGPGNLLGGDLVGMNTWEAILRQFDISLLTAASVELDLANAYYLYIMAALYMGVPAITGQLVLGAKAGAAGMVNSMIGGASGKGGDAAGSSFGSAGTNRALMGSENMGQQFAMKSLRGSGLQQKVTSLANAAMGMGIQASHADKMAGIKSTGADLQGMHQSSRQSSLNTAKSYIGGATSIGKDGVGTLKRIGKVLSPFSGEGANPSAASGSGTSGTGGGGAGGGDPRTVRPSNNSSNSDRLFGRSRSIAGAAAGFAGRTARTAWGVANQDYQDRLQQASLTASADAKVAGNQLGILSGALGQAKGIADTAGNRRSTEAGFSMKQDMYRGMARHATQMAPKLAAMGVGAGTLKGELAKDAGGFQASGQLGKQAHQDWGYAYRGGGAQSLLRGNVGSQLSALEQQAGRFSPVRTNGDRTRAMGTAIGEVPGSKAFQDAVTPYAQDAFGYGHQGMQKAADGAGKMIQMGEKALKKPAA